MEEIIKKITKQFSKYDDVEIITPFIAIDSFWILGKIEVDFKGAKLAFETTLPETYPMTHPCSDNISIQFVNKGLIGYSHINNNGSVCFHPDKGEDFDRKIEAELSGLKGWIFDYYIHDKEDERYEYLIPSFKGNMRSVLYFGDNTKQFKRGEFGSFSYFHFSNFKSTGNNKKHFQFDYYFNVGFDEKYKDKWSKDFHSLLKYDPNKSKYGLWCYIEEEPLKKLERKRLLVNSWKELQSYLPPRFISKIFDILRKKDRSYLKNNELFVLLGYKIPTEENYEVHWSLIKVPLKDMPFRKINLKKQLGVVKQSNIEFSWGWTVNSNYNRFFGRGRLTDKLTNSRILILGVGALGSSLAEILVRGGAKNIVIDDFDIVESGNLCRANYTLHDLGLSKVESLRKRLLSISPFVNVNTVKFKINFLEKGQLEKLLNNEFDFVFDCSTDPEIPFLLDRVNYSGKIFSLGLTNNAKHLTCITGSNIRKETDIIYDCLESEPASFFEGAGCGYPTFNASFNDINTVLNLSIKKINETLHANETLNSFFIENLSSTNPQIEIVEYDIFFQDEMQHYLLFPKGLFQKIELNLIQHYPKEFGGIFIGYKSTQFNGTLIKDILLPDNYENGKSEFIRYPKFFNERLETLFNESNGRIEYLGEFHSHPNALPIPSKVDYNAMSSISKEARVTTNEPILMIGQIDKQSLIDAKFYAFYKNKLYEYQMKG